MILVKGNKQIVVENERAYLRYLSEGYDEIDGAGKVVRTATGGKTVTPAELIAVRADYEARIAKLTAENAKLKKKLKEPAAEAAE